MFLYTRSPSTPFAHTRFFAQLIQVLCSQVALMHEQAQEHLTMFRTPTAHTFQEWNVPNSFHQGLSLGMVGNSAQQQMAVLSQHSHAPPSNPMNSHQRGIQAQDSLSS